MNPYYVLIGFVTALMLFGVITFFIGIVQTAKEVLNRDYDEEDE